MISIKSKCSFKKTNNFLERLKRLGNFSKLDYYGKLGVEELRKRTPIDSGLLAESWDYKIDDTDNGMSITWLNNDIEGGCNVAILIQYGHATKNGSYVSGRDFVNPAMEVVLMEIENDLRKEMRGL